MPQEIESKRESDSGLQRVFDRNDCRERRRPGGNSKEFAENQGFAFHSFQLQPVPDNHQYGRQQQQIGARLVRKYAYSHAQNTQREPQPALVYSFIRRLHGAVQRPKAEYQTEVGLGRSEPEAIG